MTIFDSGLLFGPPCWHIYFEYKNDANFKT